jgi:hypothetical protein
MMAATVFLVLLAGHFLDEWVLQSDWQATNKTRSWAALAHVASYHSSWACWCSSRYCATAGRPGRHSLP